MHTDKAHAALNQVAALSASQEAGLASKQPPAAASESASEGQQEVRSSGATAERPRQGRKLSLERDVYYFENNRREEVVTYDNRSMHPPEVACSRLWICM